MKTKIEQKYANITPKMRSDKKEHLSKELNLTGFGNLSGLRIEVGTGIEPV